MTSVHCRSTKQILKYMTADICHIVFSCLCPERYNIFLDFRVRRRHEDMTNKGIGHEIFLPTDTKTSKM